MHTVEKITKLINCCYVLHNLCIDNDVWDEEDISDNKEQFVADYKTLKKIY